MLNYSTIPQKKFSSLTSVRFVFKSFVNNGISAVNGRAKGQGWTFYNQNCKYLHNNDFFEARINPFACHYPGQLKGQPKMPQVYITQYNRFVDMVLNRINRMLGKQYDPVRVKLLSPAQIKNMKGKMSPKTSSEEKSGNGELTNKMGELEVARVDNTKYEVSKEGPTRQSKATKEPEFVLISKVGSTGSKKENIGNSLRQPSRPLRQNNKKKGANNSNNKKTTNSNKNKISTNNNKAKQSAAKNKQKAKATLFGLSTLKRDGDVQVNMMSDHTTVKTNFVLGPLTLRVEREVGRSGKRELRSATATTAEMFGRLNLKLVHGGTATLNSIRVLQPKQVRIDSTDNHDKTAEFMWKRSPQIASIVSQKLGAVARSMLRPQPKSRQ